MKTEDIHKLLDAYYEGTISQQEEEILLHYFGGESVAPELADEKLIFMQMHNADEVPIPPLLESKLDTLISELAVEETKTKDLQSAPKKKYNLWMWVTSAAACIAIMFSIGFFLLEKPNIQDPTNSMANVQPEDTFSDPEQAYAEAEKALLLVSANLNKGLSQFTSAQEDIDKSNKIVNKSLNRIKPN